MTSCPTIMTEELTERHEGSMTIVEIADRSIEINRNLRVAVYEILALAEGLAKSDRERLVPKIKAALEASSDMPTGYDLNAALPHS